MMPSKPPPPSAKSGPPKRNVRRELPKEAATADSPEPPNVARAPGTTTPPPPVKPKAPLSTRFPRVFKAITGVRILVGIAIVTGASVGVGWGAKRYMTTSPRFSIKAVQIDGIERKTAQEIADLGGLRVGENVFSFDIESAKRSIEEDPWVKSATVTRKLPGSVIVTVVEHEPAALVAIEDKLYLASRTGDVFKELGPDDPVDLPVITGIDQHDVASDRQGVQKDVQRALDVVDELDKTTIVKRYPLQEVHLVEDGTVEVIVGSDGVSIHLGAMPYRGKLEQAERVFDELSKRKAEPTIVFLDNESSPDKVVVRMR